MAALGAALSCHHGAITRPGSDINVATVIVVDLRSSKHPHTVSGQWLPTELKNTRLAARFTVGPNTEGSALHAASAAAWHFALGFHGVVLVCVSTAAVSWAARNEANRMTEQ